MNQRTIRIRDLGLAAALISSGHEMRETSRDATGRADFIFSHTDMLDRIVNAYWADTLDVHARHYFDAIKMLKSRIYGDR